MKRFYQGLWAIIAVLNFGLFIIEINLNDRFIAIFNLIMSSLFFALIVWTWDEK